MAKSILIVLLVSLLAACGGGSDSTGADQTTSIIPVTPPAATFSPSSVSQTYDMGESNTFTVQGTLTSQITEPVYVFILDNKGVITSDVSITRMANGSYTATLKTSPSLAAGRYEGNFELRLCRDPNCAAQFSGSPVLLPYVFQVNSLINLTALSRWSNVNDWETFQGNAAHTGYVPVTLDPAQFSQRWRWIAPDSGIRVSPVVAANGLVYTSTSGYFAATSKLIAISEDDKSTQWQHDFGSIFALNPPAISGSKVYAATSGHSDTFMWSFNASTGTQLFRTPFNSQWEHYYAPTVSNGSVYTNGGYYGGMNSFDAALGTTNWFTSLAQYDQWTPAVDANYAYAYVGGSLNVLNRSTGALAFSIPDPRFDSSAGVYGAPIIGSNTSVITVNGRDFYGNDLVSFNINQRNVSWSKAGKYSANPALANGIIYAVNDSPYQLEARRESDGALQWSWSPTDSTEKTFIGNVIATANMVLLSTNKRVYAISLVTHAPVWSYSKPGELALSANGVLYIATSTDGESDGGITAINMK